MSCTYIEKLKFVVKLNNKCAISSAGRAVRLHRKGREFKSLIAHTGKTKAQFLKRNCAFVLETELLQFRACVRAADMFLLVPREETVEAG